MEMINNFFEKNTDKILSALSTTSMSDSDALIFISEFKQELVNNIILNGPETIFASFVTGDCNNFISKIDTGRISTATNLALPTIESGINSIWPLLRSLFTKTTDTDVNSASDLFNSLTGFMK